MEKRNGKALLPIFVFVVLYLGLGILFEYGLRIEMGFYKIPVVVIFLIALLVACLQNRALPLNDKLAVMGTGISDPNIITMILIFMLAGIFVGVVGRSSANSVAYFILSLIPPQFAVAVLFIVSCLVSLAMGTSVGTITLIVPIGIAVAKASGFSVPLCIASVMSGAMFGDNLSFISDTTIAACNGQGCKMTDKFKENFFIALPAAIVTIVKSAFTGSALAGGAAGTMVVAMQKGIARGIFSNEAGLGSAPIAAAAAQTHSTVRQGLVSMTGTFIDTIVICTLTALVILCSGVPVGYGEAAGAELTILGFTSTYGNWVSIFTAVAMCCFAFSTIIGWGLYGTRCVEFLLGTKANKPFMVLYALVAIVGATMELGLMWNIAETFNGLMAIPNLIAVFLLSGVVVRLVKEYFAGEGKES